MDEECPFSNPHYPHTWYTNNPDWNSYGVKQMCMGRGTDDRAPVMEEVDVMER